MKTYLLSCALLLLAAGVFAGSSRDSIARVPYAMGGRRLGLMMEQDFILDLVGLKGNQDRNYTMGLGFIMPWQKLGVAPLKLLNRWRNAGSRPYVLNNGSFMLANSSFTPLYLGNNQKDSLYYMVNDRPFAGINYIAGEISFSRGYNPNTYFSTGLHLGILGLNVSNAFQSHVHRNHWFGTNREIPYGWENQISKGGAFTFLYYLQRNNLLLGKIRSESDTRAHFQLSQSVEGKVGYYVAASYALNFRLGWLDKRNWGTNNFPLSRSSGVPMASATAVPRVPGSNRAGTGRKPNEFYLLGNLKPNLWLYNAFLSGQFADDFHTLTWKQVNHVTVEGNLGLGTQLPVSSNSAVNLALTVSTRSPEFHTVAEFTRWHSWGGIQAYFVY